MRKQNDLYFETTGVFVTFSFLPTSKDFHGREQCFFFEATFQKNRVHVSWYMQKKIILVYMR